VRFDDLIEHVRNNRSFRAEAFGLPTLECDWLDAGLVGIGKSDAPIATTDFSEFTKLAIALRFGDKFPIPLHRSGSCCVRIVPGANPGKHRHLAPPPRRHQRSRSLTEQSLA
jgi:hypothetical protein